MGGGAFGHVDGFGSAANFREFRGMTYANGYVWFLDGACGTLRRYDPGTTEVKTIVGDPTCPGGQTFQTGFGGILPTNGGASLASPRYMTTDLSGFLYISDNFDHTISRYNMVTNYLEPFVGAGTQGPAATYSDDYFGLLAEFDRPRDLASDGTSLYVADFDNYTIRQVNLATTRVTTMVGFPAPSANPNTKCDHLHGQGASAANGSRFTKPLELYYHYTTNSMFFTTGGEGGNCGNTVRNQVWRIR